MPPRSRVRIWKDWIVQCDDHGEFYGFNKREEAEQEKRNHIAAYHEGKSWLIPDFNDVWGGAGPDNVLAPA